MIYRRGVRARRVIRYGGGKTNSRNVVTPNNFNKQQTACTHIICRSDRPYIIYICNNISYYKNYTTLYSTFDVHKLNLNNNPPPLYCDPVSNHLLTSPKSCTCFYLFIFLKFLYRTNIIDELFSQHNYISYCIKC